MNTRAALLPALLLLLAILGYSGALEWGTAHGPLGSVEHNVTAYLDRSETTAVEAFAVARAINAAVSLLKSADLSAVVAQIAPLQVLEPVDDLAKQFSDVMVVSIVAIQMQRLLLLVSRAWAFSALLPLGCVLLAATAFLPTPLHWRTRLARLGRMVIVIAIFARCIVLAAGLVGNGLTEKFLAGDLHNTMNLLSASGTHLTQISTNTAPVAPPAGAPPQTGMLSRLEKSMQEAVQAAKTSTAAASSWVPDRAQVTAFVSDVPDQIVRAIEIFLVQTMLTPILVALALYLALRAVMRPI